MCCDVSHTGVNTNGRSISAAVAAWSCAGPSTVVTNTTTLTPVAPGPPHHVTVVVNATSATVTWQPPDGAADVPLWYYIQQASSPVTDASAPVWTIGATVTATCCSYTFSGLSTTLEYQFTVSASNAEGNSTGTPSDIAVPGTSMPIAPTGVTAVSHRANVVVLTWYPVSSDLNLNGGSPIIAYTCAGYFINGSTVSADNDDVVKRGYKTQLAGLLLISAK